MSDQNLEYDRDRYEPYGVNNIGRGAGITITTGFDVSAQMPLDARTVVETLADLYAMPQDVIYMGLLVYVIEDNKLYQWKEVLQDDKTYEIGWGPIEAEVSAKEIEDIGELDLKNIKSLQMQKNKENFFPITHEKYIYNEKGESLFEELKEYQKKDLSADENGEKLETKMQTIVGAINELNSKMDDTIEDFENKINQTIEDLNASVDQMQKETSEDMAQLKADTEADFAAMKQEMQDNLDEMNRVFDETMDEINAEMDALEAQIESRVDQMLKDVDNSILTDLAVNNFMEQINANLAKLDAL